MTRPTRLVSITYGGLKVGEGTNYDLHAVHRISEGYERFELEFTLVFRGSTSTAAKTLDAAFRAAYTKPDQSDFALIVNGVTWLTFSHTADTWLNPRADFETIPEFRSERSRGYKVTISAEMPADLAGRAARRSSRSSVSRDQAGNLHLQVSADYTSTGGTSAYDQALASFPTFVGTVQTAAGGGTWLPTDRIQITFDDQSKLATATAAYVQDRTLTIAYGGLTVGTGTNYDIREIQEIRETYESQDVVFVVTFDAANTTAAKTLDAAFRAAFTKPDQSDFVVTLNSVVWLSLSHSAQTGMNSRAVLTPLPEFFSTLSYGYRVTLSFDLPADLSGRAGRQTSRWTTTTRPTGQKLLEVTAVYTALAGVGTAFVTADADFDTYVGVIQGIVGGTWVEALAVELTLDDQNKLCTARAEYQQRLIGDTASGADADFEVRGYTVFVERPEVSVARGSNAKPLARAAVSFGADVLKSVSLSATYTSKILPYLAALVTSSSDLTGTPKVALERVEFDPWLHVIQGTVTYLVPQSTVLAASRRIRSRENSGKTLVPLLDRDKPFEKIEYDGPRFKIRTVELITLEVFGGSKHEAFVTRAIKDAKAAGFIWIDTETIGAETEVPTVRGAQLQFIERASIINFEFSGKVGAGTSGGSDFNRTSRVPAGAGSSNL